MKIYKYKYKRKYKYNDTLVDIHSTEIARYWVIFSLVSPTFSTKKKIRQAANNGLSWHQDLQEKQL